MRSQLENGGWFDSEQAQAEWEEGSWWDGNNHISNHTSSQWEHQKLYWTRKGSWVLRCWSQYESTPTTYHQITIEEASAWLILAGRSEDLEGLPEQVRAEVERQLEETEV